MKIKKIDIIIVAIIDHIMFIFFCFKLSRKNKLILFGLKMATYIYS